MIGSWTNCELPRKSFEPNACWALRTGHQHLVLAGDTTARCSHAAGVKHTYLCVPILAQGEALGIMHFQATDESPNMGEAELSFKTTFAGQVGLSIANINLRDALRTQSIKDPLTGLYNRRYLEEMLQREIRRAGRAEQSLGILMLDLDHFKAFNDTYGHDAGDAVLRETASFVAGSVRAEDTVCRFGGEEFVVILPTANLDGAQVRAESIRSKLRELTVLHQGQSLGMITVSIGVCAFPVNGTSPRICSPPPMPPYTAPNAKAGTGWSSPTSRPWQSPQSPTRPSPDDSKELVWTPLLMWDRVSHRSRRAAPRFEGQLRCPGPLLSSLAITPSLMWMTRWAYSAISPSWVTRMIVLPSAWSRSNRAMISIPGLRIQIARRFIGQNDGGLVDQGARDRDTLALAA